MTVETNVRPADLSVADECGRIDDAARADLLVKRGGEAWLVEHPRLVDLHQWWSDSFVALVDDVVVGYLVGRVDVDGRGRVFVVERVFVLEAARGLGCGDDLLAAAIDHAIAGLRVRGGNCVAGRPRDEESVRTRRGDGPLDHRVSPPQRPVQFGERFSMKAVRPSLVSSEAMTSANKVLVSVFNSSSG